MTNLKIAIYTICKNEEHFVNRWAKSNSDADLRLVCDTGSTDNTIKSLQEHNVNVFPITVNPWRFDFARNTALNLLPADIDVCIWQDLDEELLPGWRKEVEAHWQNNTTIANHRYRHNNGPWQWHSKIHARHNCHWIGHVHETLKWTIPENSIWLNEFYLDEHQDTSKTRSNYLDLLLKKIQEGDRNWRTYYFLSNDYQAVDMNESIKYRLKSYNAIGDNEPLLKSYVSRTLARQHASMNNKDEARRWFKISTGHSNERESWYYLTEFFYNNHEWDECYVAAKKCLSINERRNGFTFDPVAWGVSLYDYAALSAYNLELYKQAVEYGTIACELNPVDDRLKNNLNFYREKYGQS